MLQLCLCTEIRVLITWVKLYFPCHSQVPLSVPSQPSSPESKQQTTGLETNFAAMTIPATTAMPITTTQAEPTFQHPASNSGVGQQTTNNTTITPAPVTIVRSSLPPDPSKFSQPSAPSSTTSGLGIHPLIGMPTTSHETYQQTSSGLPTAPPTNFAIPILPPTISLGPTPILQSGTSHTSSSSGQQWTSDSGLFSNFIVL